ncbi:hypothetical protein BUE76_07310 [Cnuella takakiae]|nr:hypothetical protein BUE76_07310 [Cnuella takakiae]
MAAVPVSTNTITCDGYPIYLSTAFLMGLPDQVKRAVEKFNSSCLIDTGNLGLYLITYSLRFAFQPFNPY